MVEPALQARRAPSSPAILLALSSESTGALRALLRLETLRVEQWVRAHESTASKSTIRDTRTYLEQLRSLRHEVETAIESMVSMAVAATGISPVVPVGASS